MHNIQLFTSILYICINELLLFAAIGFLVIGLDDFVLDCAWIARTLFRRHFVYQKHTRICAATLPSSQQSGRLIIFVPAWQESAVIGQMLRTALCRLDHDNYSIYIGCYPNDIRTIGIVADIALQDARIKLVIHHRDGPTTKADCLNQLWHALRRDEIRLDFQAKAIILHDAEDIVHSMELRVFDTLIERFALVQLPVFPLINPKSRWIAGHYLDEFAEAHSKEIIMREALGAAVPSAGVGCAIACATLADIAHKRGGDPFDQDSLTEDYELGLRIALMGERGIFVRIPAMPGGQPIAVRAHFPANLSDAVQQKSRWIAGIALAGWDRMGWTGGISEFWMRLRDRRALLNALVLLSAYAGLALSAITNIFVAVLNLPKTVQEPVALPLLMACMFLCLWRLAMRFIFVTRIYGWVQGLYAIPRAIIANIILMIAARRALFRYLALRRNGQVIWGKTQHIFPDTLPAE